MSKLPEILEQIVEKKKPEVKALYKSGKFSEYKILATSIQKPRDFYSAITRPGLNLIAEFKRKSPAKGYLRENADPQEIARIYEECGASAISVLTDSNFDGKISHLYKIRQAVKLPLLRKDFIIDIAQIYEARAYRADAVLLIARILDLSQISDFVGLSSELGMHCLVECHNESELEKAIRGGAKIIGINNRNLEDFSIDRSTTLRLLPYVPEGYPIVTESGISTCEHVKELSNPRINAILVGETLMSAKLNPTIQDIKYKIYELLGKK